jgi:hypothetical protein
MGGEDIQTLNNDGLESKIESRLLSFNLIRIDTAIYSSASMKSFFCTLSTTNVVTSKVVLLLPGAHVIVVPFQFELATGTCPGRWDYS